MSHAPEFATSPGGLSKRAAQRLIQRAIVLAARDRNVRQHIREADLDSVWEIADWRMEWAVAIRRGRLEFDRRLPHRPDIRVTWPSAEDFFAGIAPPEAPGPQDTLETGERRGNANLVQPRYEGPMEARRTWEVVLKAFRAALGELLQNPVDQDGRNLI